MSSSQPSKRPVASPLAPPLVPPMTPAKPFFPELRLRGALRPSQSEVVEIARKKLKTGARKLHIVAPPGSGKTILGLFLWADLIKTPALVLSPNSAIQAQWTARTDLFQLISTAFPGPLTSMDATQPGLLTSLTYQAVTMPGRASDDLDGTARDLWQEKLVERDQAQTLEEAEQWLADLKRRNPEFYEQRLATYRKTVRDAMARGGDALLTLHSSSLNALDRLRQQKIGLIILDECHHLLGHWGRVLADAQEMFGNPMVIGLTATPPDRTGKLAEDIQRYDDYLGPIDFEVPVPAVVKDGYLAPYQDLAYFVRPTAEELTYIATADQTLFDLVEELCKPLEKRSPALKPLPASSDTQDAPNSPLARESLTEWLLRVLTEKRLPNGLAKDWAAFERRDPDFASAARWFLQRRKIKLPLDVPPIWDDWQASETPALEQLAPVLDRYVRHRLRHSADPRDQQLAEDVVGRLRVLGIQVTESGWQACASPVGRVMAYSKAKGEALVPILSTELGILGDKIRAVVVADFEKTSATSAKIENLLGDESGGAIAAFKVLVKHPRTDLLDPVLVTGSSVLIDDDIALKFVKEASEWLTKKGYEAGLTLEAEEGFQVLIGSGADWCPRVYVELVTELFQRGTTRCLVGTRGLLGEGWDASKTNVLVDLTSVTTCMSVNQLRGRSIRLDSTEPQKLANNWDVVCLASEFSKGLDDYHRFCAKHETLYGVTDDGAIEKGVGHVHPAFTQMRPEGLEGSAANMNEEMLARAYRRTEVRQLWKVGQPYRGLPLRALEYRLQMTKEAGTFPAIKGPRVAWNDKSLSLAIGKAVLTGLVEAKLVRIATDVHFGERAGGYVRLFLEGANEEDSQVFSQAVAQVLGPLDTPRYIISRYADEVQHTFLSSILPTAIGQYFERRRRKCVMVHAVPEVLAKNRESVLMFERAWNRFVSPGKAIFVQRGEGEQALAEARRTGQVSTAIIHEKQVFL